jgi:hypothetical protein
LDRQICTPIGSEESTADPAIWQLGFFGKDRNGNVGASTGAGNHKSLPFCSWGFDRSVNEAKNDADRKGKAAHQKLLGIGLFVNIQSASWPCCVGKLKPPKASSMADSASNTASALVSATPVRIRVGVRKTIHFQRQGLVVSTISNRVPLYSMAVPHNAGTEFPLLRGL